MKLTDLDPSWIDHGGRRGIGVRFRCMVPGHCSGYLWILFANPLDGGPAWEGESFKLILEKRDEEGQYEKYKYDRPCGTCRWRRTGDNFATMSMSPSVNAHCCGHLTLTNGVFG
jgi:hypothetical protein